jgi:hypothetical protein
MAMLHEVEVAFKLHPDVRSMDENWFGKSNSFDRRKLQNRLNQRALRESTSLTWPVVSKGLRLIGLDVSRSAKACREAV